MSLPVLNSHSHPARGDLVRLFHRTQARWVGHLAEPETLEFAVAFANPELAGVWDANHVVEVALRGGITPAQASDRVGQHFAQRGTRCWHWVMDPSASAGETVPMIEHLTAQGYQAVSDDILYLRRMPTAPVQMVSGLQIIPARASYRHCEELARRVVTERWAGLKALEDAHLRHLDDPHWDAILALKDGQVVAGAGVLAVGELGRIEHVYVVPECRRQGIGRTMMARALEICARSLFRHVFLVVERGNSPAQTLYANLGFEKIGEMTVYRKES